MFSLEMPETFRVALLEKSSSQILFKLFGEREAGLYSLKTPYNLTVEFGDWRTI